MKTRIKLSLALSVVLGIVLTAFMIFCHLNYVDPYSLLVTQSAAVNIFGVACTAAIVLVLLLPKLTVRGCDISGEAQNTSFVIFAASLLGFLFAGYIVNFLLVPFRGIWSSAEIPTAAASAFDGGLRILHILSIVLALPCAVYFIMIALRKNIGRSAGLSLLSVSPVLFCAARLIYSFLATSAKVNAAGRKITITAFCFCIFFFLAEANLLAPENGKHNNKKETLKLSSRYLASGCAAIIALFVSQVSTTLLQAFWLLEQSDTYILNGIYITMILYIAARISSVPVNKAE